MDRAYLDRPLSDPDPLRQHLLAQKQAQQRAYLSALRSQTDPAALGRSWTEFAETQTIAALRAAWRRCRAAKPFVKDAAADAPIPGLFILGLGKIGGSDLNFSSDIDLMAFYDPARLPVPAAAGRTYVSSEVLRGLIRLIDGHGSGRFCWRTDWRLRPDPSVTDLAMSTDAGIDYFYFQSAPWRRLALIKARVVAGDREAGDAFLARLHAFIWRRNLDFSMVQEIASLKQRIHLEHPDLADARRVSHDLQRQEKFNLKLGRGGIRDIEFVVNALQLLWGGRHIQLQTPHTQTALESLGDLGLLDGVADLGAAYAQLRTLENAVQGYADRHTHLMPTQAPQRAWLEQVCNRPFAELEEELAHHRAQVAQAFDALFAGVEPAPHLPALTHVRLADWNLSERTALGLGRLLSDLDQLIADQPNPEAAMAPLQRWLTRLRGKDAYLAALQEAPRLARLAFASLLESPLVATLVDQTPQVLDSLFVHGDLLSNPSAAPLIARGRTQIQAAPRGEARLAAARTWINESLYLIYLATMDGQISAAQTGQVLGQVAEGALDLCAQIVADDLGQAHLPFTILAMGRLGQGRMAPGSDLDLIFVLDAGVDLVAGNRAVARFMTAVNARLAEGRVYEIDTRLRPSGASGPPTLRLETFVEHQLTRAKTWEHLALTFMRPLAGTYHSRTEQRQGLDALRRQVLATPRDLDQWRGDAQVMLRRLQEQRIEQPDQAPGEVKLAAGGLMELDYVSAAHLLARPDLRTHAQALEDLGLDAAAATQSAALVYQRLYGPTWTDKHPKLATAFAETRARVREALQHLLGPAKAFPRPLEWEETCVRWRDPP